MFRDWQARSRLVHSEMLDERPLHQTPSSAVDISDSTALALRLGVTPRRIRQLAAQHGLGRQVGGSRVWVFSDEDEAIMRMHIERAGWRIHRKTP
jgi:hypothetical protein